MERKHWDRLGEAVLDRRTTKGWTQQEVAERGGPSDTLQSDIEQKRWAPSRNVKETLRKIDAGMEWESGSAARVLEGGSATPREVARGEVARRILDAPASEYDQHFDRAERLLTHSHESARHGDYLGAIHGLEGAQSTVELLIDRISAAAGETNGLDIETQSDAQTEAVKDEEADLPDEPKSPWPPGTGSWTEHEDPGVGGSQDAGYGD